MCTMCAGHHYQAGDVNAAGVSPPDTAFTAVTATGDASIDGILWTSKWATTSLTYAFPTSATDYSGNGTLPTGYTNFTAFSATQQLQANAALDYIETITGLTFTLGTVTTATIRFANAEGPGTALGFYPNMPQDLVPGVGPSASGDTWYETSGSSGTFFATFSFSTYGWTTLLHELGHTLGFKHAHQNFSFGANPPSTDAIEYTIMSYRTYVNDPTATVFDVETGGAPTTMMMYDIAGLQYLYGANYTTNATDTTYTWSKTTGTMSVNGVAGQTPGANRVLMTLWDGGGIDTYDLATYDVGLNIDLRPGFFSILDPVQRSELSVQTAGAQLAQGNVYNALLYEGDVRSLIENVIGGSASDTINGNEADNSLTGGGGDDSIDGNEGNDTLEGSAGANTLAGGDGDDSLYGTHLDLMLAGSDADTIQLVITAALAVTIDGGIGSDLAVIDVAGADATGYTYTYNSFERLLFFGGGLADNVVGTAGADTIESGGGSDTVATGDGADSIIAGVGDDSVDGGADADTIRSSGGFDTLLGAAGNDVFEATVSGAGGTLSIAGGGGSADFASLDFSAAGSYTLAMTGVETLFLIGSGLADNLAIALIGNDTLFGQDGNDTIQGGAGNDNLRGDSGDDDIFGGLGTDFLHIQTNGNDLIDGGAERDTLYVVQGLTRGDFELVTSFTFRGVAYVNDQALRNVVTGEVNRLIGIETIQYEDEIGAPGTFNEIVGNDSSNGLTGTAGRDIIYGLGSNDNLSGGDGDDFLDGGTGSDNVNGQNGNDTIFALQETSQLYILEGGAGIDLLIADWSGSASSQVGLLTSTNDSFRYFNANTGSDLIGSGFERFHLTGGGGRDRLVGGALADTLIGNGGNDTLDSGIGAATINGGAGADLWIANLSAVSASITFTLPLTQNALVNLAGGSRISNLEQVTLTLGAGDDSIGVGALSDTIIAGAGNDTISAVVGGNDSIDGGAGTNDLLIADWSTGVDSSVVLFSGSVMASGSFRYIDQASGYVLNGTGFERFSLTGGAGFDQLTGADETDTLIGGGGNDTLVANGGADSIDGGVGADSVIAGAGADTVLAGDGADTIKSDDGADSINGGDGVDQLSFVGDTVGVYIDLTNGFTQDAFGNYDMIANIESAKGTNAFRPLSSQLSDLFLGNAADNLFEGFGGQDYVSGGAGADTILLGDGVDDIALGDAGDDSVTGELGADFIYGGDGSDRLDGGDGADWLFGGGFGDPATMTGSDTMTGGAGGDVLAVGSSGGAASMDGGSGNDTLYGGSATAGADTIKGGAGFDFMYGAAGADTYRFDATDIIAGDFDQVFGFKPGDTLSFAATLSGQIAGQQFTINDISGAYLSVNVTGGAWVLWLPYLTWTTVETQIIYA